jgi:hypothetical protein
VETSVPRNAVEASARNCRPRLTSARRRAPGCRCRRWLFRPPAAAAQQAFRPVEGFLAGGEVRARSDQLAALFGHLARWRKPRPADGEDARPRSGGRRSRHRPDNPTAVPPPGSPWGAGGPRASPDTGVGWARRVRPADATAAAPVAMDLTRRPATPGSPGSGDLTRIRGYSSRPRSSATGLDVPLAPVPDHRLSARLRPDEHQVLLPLPIRAAPVTGPHGRGAGRTEPCAGHVAALQATGTRPCMVGPIGTPTRGLPRGRKGMRRMVIHRSDDNNQDRRNRSF